MLRGRRIQRSNTLKRGQGNAHNRGKVYTALKFPTLFSTAPYAVNTSRRLSLAPLINFILFRMR